MWLSNISFSVNPFEIKQFRRNMIFTDLTRGFGEAACPAIDLDPVLFWMTKSYLVSTPLTSVLEGVADVASHIINVSNLTPRVMQKHCVRLEWQLCLSKPKCGFRVKKEKKRKVQHVQHLPHQCRCAECVCVFIYFEDYSNLTVWGWEKIIAAGDVGVGSY